MTAWILNSLLAVPSWAFSFAVSEMAGGCGFGSLERDVGRWMFRAENFCIESQSLLSWTILYLPVCSCEINFSITGQIAQPVSEKELEAARRWVVVGECEDPGQRHFLWQPGMAEMYSVESIFIFRLLFTIALHYHYFLPPSLFLLCRNRHSVLLDYFLLATSNLATERG